MKKMLEHATTIRLISFAVIFILVALWEIRTPRRRLKTSKKARWIANLSIITINPVLLRLVFPLLAVETAQSAQVNGWGLLNKIEIPSMAAVGIGIVLVDLVVYLQHVMFHAVPLLWRLHMMHHTDLDYDLTTGLRFHPIEIVMSMTLKLTVIVALGPPVFSVLAFEIILNGMALFNHANIKTPQFVDTWLRRVVVTPDMHRVHHSVIIRETNSNYGFNLSCWDRLFGTYKDQPEKGQADMVIGLAQFRDPQKLSLWYILVMPFVGDTGRVPINRH
jgi:sterol desaturase/sphingolipid hydroxylase (fatty acid hydroxylase superfamily)